MLLLLSACSLYVEQQYRAASAEVPANLDFLRTAQLLRAARGQPWLACEGAGCSALGWPADGVRGEYRVEVSSTGFTVHGSIDLDEDGVPARWVATETAPPRRLTDPEVL